MKSQPSPQDNGGLSEVQARLMKMLDSVRLDDKPATAATPGQSAPKTNKAKLVATLATKAQASASASSAPAAPTARTAKPADSTCTNCDNTEDWKQSPWCTKCGFYPKLNRVMEGVVADNDQSNNDPLDDIDFDKFFPPWAYGIVVGMFFVLLESIAVRMLVSDLESRGSFALFQIMIGTITFAIAHGRAYLVAAFASTKISPGNMITTPIAIWSEVFKLLPKHKKVLCSAVWSATAILLAVAVIGVDWNGLFKPDQVTKVRKINPFKWLMKTVVSMAASQQQAQGANMAALGGGGGASAGLGSGDISFEESLTGFADVAGANELAQGIGGAGGAAGVASMMGGGGLPGFGGADGVGSGDNLEGSISNFTDVAGANEVSQGAFSANSLPQGGQMSGGPSGHPVTGPAMVSSSFSTGGGPVSTGAFTGSTAPPGTTSTPGAVRVVSPVTAPGQAPPTSSSSNGPTGLTAKPITTLGTTTDPNTVIIIEVPHPAAISPTPPSSGTGTAGETAPVAPSAPKKPRDTTDLVIFGFTTNAQGEIRSLLLAESKDDRKARFVGRVYLDTVSPVQIAELEAKLKARRTARPAVACPYGGYWVRPDIYCTVSHEGWSGDGRVEDGRLQSYSTVAPVPVQPTAAPARPAATGPAMARPTAAG